MLLLRPILQLRQLRHRAGKGSSRRFTTARVHAGCCCRPVHSVPSGPQGALLPGPDGRWENEADTFFQYLWSYHSGTEVPNPGPTGTVWGTATGKASWKHYSSDPEDRGKWDGTRCQQPTVATEKYGWPPGKAQIWLFMRKSDF